MRNPSAIHNNGEQYWIVTGPNSGYILGGKNFHHHYAHGKIFLSTHIDGYSISNVYRELLPFHIDHSNSFHKSRSAIVQFSSSNPKSSHVWQQQFITGAIPTSFTANFIIEANALGIKRRFNNVLVWMPGDLFQNTGILQVLNLHPARSGVAGKGYAVSILFSDSFYENSVVILKENSQVLFKSADYSYVIIGFP